VGIKMINFIYFEDYFGFKYLDTYLTKLNVFIGDNNTGKTHLLAVVNSIANMKNLDIIKDYDSLESNKADSYIVELENGNGYDPDFVLSKLFFKVPKNSKLVNSCKFTTQLLNFDKNETFRKYRPKFDKVEKGIAEELLKRVFPTNHERFLNSYLFDKFKEYENCISGVITFEHPENGMSHRAQDELGRILIEMSNSGVQVFVETHSEILLTSFRVEIKQGSIGDEHVLILNFNDNGYIQRVFIDENGRYLEHPDGFFDTYSNQLDKLLGID
jgi:hypothetical protein